MTGNNKASLLLQPRDLRLLEALESMRVINREQAKSICGFRSTTRANARLLALTQSGYLKRTFLGNREAVYWLAGKSKANSLSELTAREVAGLFLRHHLEINRVRLLLEYSGIPVRGWWLIFWRAFRENLSPGMPLIPDGYFELRSQAGVRGCFVEVDLGTESVQVFQRKVQLYLQLATSDEFTKLFGQQQFRVLVVANSERRLANLRSAISKLTDKIFWLTTLDNINPDSFWSAVWLRPTGDQKQSLL